MKWTILVMMMLLTACESGRNNCPSWIKEIRPGASDDLSAEDLLQAKAFLQTPTEVEAEWLEGIGRPAPPTMWRAVGCGNCNDLGYRGRVGLFEVGRVNAQDAERILDRFDDHRMRQALRERGHRFLIDDALDKVADGLTDIRQIRHLAGG